jgi:ABC-2 type transport system ATP-binding protein
MPGHPVDTVDSVETDSILAKFDERIAELEADNAKERREFRAAQRREKAAAEAAAAEADEAAETEPTAIEEAIEPPIALVEAFEPVEVIEPAAPAEPAKATAPSKPAARKKAPRASARRTKGDREEILQIRGLVKHYGDTTAVDGIDLTVEAGTIFGIVGPNGAGKTTTLSMVTGLLRPDAGTVVVHGADVWADPAAAKRQMGVLPDRLRLFDRLTGSQLLYYAGVLRGLPASTVRERMAQLATSFGLEGALGRLVTDYSAGMTKKLSLAAALIHSPRLLVLDEPFESVDPVSAASIIEILRRYVAAGGTVVLSSHSMDLIERVCDAVAIIVDGDVLASGTVAEVRGKGTLEERFVELAGGRTTVEGLEWLHSFSD